MSFLPLQAEVNTLSIPHAGIGENTRLCGKGVLTQGGNSHKPAAGEEDGLMLCFVDIPAIILSELSNPH